MPSSAQPVPDTPAVGTRSSSGTTGFVPPSGMVNGSTSAAAYQPGQTFLPQGSYARDFDRETVGAEAWGTYAAADWWQLRAGANVLRKELHLKPGSRDIFGVSFAGNDPSFQFQAQSDMDPGSDASLNLSLRSIDALNSPRVGAYTEADAKIIWRVVGNLQLSLAGMNLLRERHVGFINGSLPPLAIARSVYLSAMLELP